MNHQCQDGYFLDPRLLLTMVPPSKVVSHNGHSFPPIIHEGIIVLESLGDLCLTSRSKSTGEGLTH